MITGQDTGHVPDQDDDLNPETEEVVAIDVDLEVDQEIANGPVVTVQGLKNREEKEKDREAEKRKEAKEVEVEIATKKAEGNY